MASPTRRPAWPEHPRLGMESQTLGSSAEDIGLHPAKGNEVTEGFSQSRR